MITYPLNNIDYTAEDAELFHCTRNSGIWAKDSFSISVTGFDNNIAIGTGIAWINNEKFSGKVVALKSAKTLDLGIADSAYPRIDVIAIQFNANNNATDIVVKKGGYLQPKSSYGYTGYTPQYPYRPATQSTHLSSSVSTSTKGSYLELNKGDMVQHTAFGRGLVLSVIKMGGDALLEIAFDQIGTKKLMAKTASAHMKRL